MVMKEVFFDMLDGFMVKIWCMPTILESAVWGAFVDQNKQPLCFQ